MLASLLIGVELIEAFHHNVGQPANFIFVERFQSIRLQLFHLGVHLGELFVSVQEHLDRIDATRDEVLPGDLAVGVLVSEREKGPEVVLRQIVVLKFLEGVVKLVVGELTRRLGVSLLKDGDKGAL